MQGKRNAAVTAPAWRRWLTVLMLAAGALGLAWWGAQAWGPQVVRIGVAQPASGPSAAKGADMRAGVRLAIEQINRQQPRVGRRAILLEAVEVDDESDPEAAERVAQALVRQKVAAVVGHLNSGASIRAAPIYAEAGIPQLTTSSQSSFTELGLPTTFRLVASDRQQSRALAAYAMTLTERPLAVVDDGTSYGRSLAETTVRLLVEQQRPVRIQRSLDNRGTDFAALVAELRESPVRVLVCILSDVQVLALGDQLAAAGLKDFQIIGSQSIKTGALLTRSLPYPVYATSPVLEPLEFPNGRRFVSEFRAINEEAPLYGAHYAYDAVHLVYAAMRHAGSTRPDDITHALRELDFVAPVTTTMKFGPDGEQLYGSVGVYRPFKGRWERLVNSDRW